MDNKIMYTKGDATAPIGEGNKIIAHICNDAGGWGAGFVLAISKKWGYPEQHYRSWYKERTNFELGNVQTVKVEPDVYVANMIVQVGYYKPFGKPSIRYEAVEQCLLKVAKYAKEHKASVHMPRIQHFLLQYGIIRFIKPSLYI